MNKTINHQYTKREGLFTKKYAFQSDLLKFQEPTLDKRRKFILCRTKIRVIEKNYS